ncbi:MAG: hypothetical protein COV67_14440 [Nitrospinae bacterium CG11_big_fil_rev_8_21_14_0_20_56_8]|nr:MAG: hypothetical protein COV67_14440 [Nitrospinae bacterium CG11_big_fil_rev_8_21_14_0_20_56_8]
MTLNQLLDFLSTQEFSIPLGQVVLYAFLSSLCLVFGKHKLGILVTFSFVFYWGFIFNRENFVNLLGQSSIGLYVYALLGMGMIVMAVIGFLHDNR